jgi:hypothetical protein
MKKDFPHKFTKEECVAGGKTITKKKRIANCLRSRKYCNAGCKLWNSCNVKYVSDSQFDGCCALKNLPLKLQNRAVKLILKGEEGIDKLLMELWLGLATDSDLNESSRRKVFYDLIALKKSVFGDKQRLEAKSEGSFTIEDIRKVLQKTKKEEIDEQKSK